jgi:hypothetical protein
MQSASTATTPSMFQETSKFALWEEKEEIIEGFIGSSCIEGLIEGRQIADGVRKGCDGSQKEPQPSSLLEDIMECEPYSDPSFRAVNSSEMFQEHLEFMYDFWARKVSILPAFFAATNKYSLRARALFLAHMLIVHTFSSHQEADAKQKLQEEQTALFESLTLARSRDFFEGDDVSILLICHTRPRAYAHFAAFPWRSPYCLVLLSW